MIHGSNSNKKHQAKMECKIKMKQGRNMKESIHLKSIEEIFGSDPDFYLDSHNIHVL